MLIIERSNSTIRHLAVSCQLIANLHMLPLLITACFARASSVGANSTRAITEVVRVSWVVEFVANAVAWCVWVKQDECRDWTNDTNTSSIINEYTIIDNDSIKIRCTCQSTFSKIQTRYT